MADQQVVPMIHVVDVQATVKWYESIGFAVLNTFEDDGELNFALLGYGNSHLMLTGGGRPSEADRRDVDLYIHTLDVEGDFQRLKDRVEILDGLDNSFYGAREFIVRDPNRYWLVFGQPIDG